MKKWLLPILVCLVATSAFAVVDPDPDMIGVYFDPTADDNCLMIGANIPFFAYVTLTNPSAPEIWGLEFGYRLTVPAGLEGLIFRLANSVPEFAVDLGNSIDPLFGDYIVGLGTPLPGTPAVQFVTWQFMILTPMPIEIYLGAAAVESIPDGLPAYEAGGTILPLGLATGGLGFPVATVNGDCPVQIEQSSFGSVKSLYR